MLTLVFTNPESFCGKSNPSEESERGRGGNSAESARRISRPAQVGAVTTTSRPENIRHQTNLSLNIQLLIQSGMILD